MIDANHSFSGPLKWLRSHLGTRPQTMPPERRGNTRAKVFVKAEIQAPGGYLWTNCIDFHRDGAKVISKQGWAIGAVLFIRFSEYRLMGFAQVRHCVPQGDDTYLIGLEFRAPLMRQESGEWQIERICPTTGVSTGNDEFATANGASLHIN